MTIPAGESRACRERAGAAGGRAGGRGDDMEALYAAYAGIVRRSVSGIVAAHEVEDVTHDVFVKVCARLDRAEPGGAPLAAWLSGRRPDNGPLAAWLARVARNQAIDHVRRRRPAAGEAPAPVTSRPPADGVLSPELHDALLALPPAQREVVVLRHLAGLTPSEIARRLNRTTASVNGLQHRATRALRRELGDGHRSRLPLAVVMLLVAGPGLPDQLLTGL